MVQVERLPNALAITEAAPLVAYVRSMWNYADAIAGREAAFSLAQLWQQDGLTPSELAERLLLQPATITNALQAMERSGMVERRRATHEQRVVEVFLTPAGQSSRAPVEAIWRTVEQCAFSEFSDDEERELHRLLSFHFLLASGRPLGEPVVFGGPFVMNTPEQISAARACFSRGEMAGWSPRWTLAAQAVHNARARASLLQSREGVCR